MKLASRLIKILGKLGLIDKFFPFGVRIAKNILPNEKEIMVGNQKMIINPKEDLGLYFGYESAEPGVVSFLSNKIEKGEVFVDIGAYKGYYSLLTSELVGEGGRVICFEPDPKNFEYILKSLEINSISNTITFNVALADFDGETSFVASGMGGHIGKGDITCTCKTLDTIIDSLELTPTMMKIDVEGSEYSVLKGGKNTLKHHHPKLLIEVHNNADFEFFDFLTSYGYSIGLVNNEGLIKYYNLSKVKKLCMERSFSEYGTRINQHVFCSME